MMFNTEQQRAIDTIDKNVCLVAGAGTGKTAVLTHRFVNIIKESKRTPLEAMESILAITFTEKATKEMLGRIGNLISEIGKERQEFYELEKYIPFANVSTIDSFCMDIIRENSIRIGLNPNFSIMPEYESKSLLNEITEGLINNRIETSEILRNMMVVLKRNRVKEISRIFTSTYSYVVNRGYDYEELLNKTFGYYDNSSNNPMNEEGYVADVLNLFSDLQSKKVMNGRHKKAIALKTQLESMNDYFYSLVDAEKINLCDYIKDIVTNFVKDQTDLSDPLLTKTNGLLKNYELKEREYYDEVVSILKEIDEVYRSFKLKEGRLEFSDLIYYAIKILDDDKILQTYRDKFQYVMVDEFQDTNISQKKLIYKICSVKENLDRNNLFIVGDPKQSIYGFRASDLRVFKNVVEDIRNAQGEYIVLSNNYRSSSHLVDFANNLFSKIMGENYSPLVANSDAADFPIEILKSEDDTVREAELIARKIISLVKSGYKYGDIAILFRSSTKLKSLEDVFNNYNIPYINPKSKEFFNKREIMDLILFLNFINTPEDDESLYGLLRSNFFLLDDDSIFMIHRYDGDFLYKKLFSYTGDNKRIKVARDILNKILNISGEVNVYELLTEFISDTKYYEFLATVTNTPQAIENVRKFEDLTLEYVVKFSGFINQFMDYLSDISTEDTNEATVDLGEKAVKFMTVHASKGLEFPVVILYDSGSFNNRGYSSTIGVSPDLGLGIKLSPASLLYSEIKATLDKEELEEQDRVLYVAFTRAKERFILSHVEKPNDNCFNKKLTSMEDYDYCIDTNLNEGERVVVKEKSLSSDETEIITREDFNNYSLPISSISAYSVFKRCPREYFYNYKLRLGNLDYHIKEKIENEERELQSLNGIGGALLGTIVHEVISEYKPGVDLDRMIHESLRNHGVGRLEISALVKRFLESYILKYHLGKKDNEAGFMMKFDEGYIVGSIDEVRFLENGDIHLVDFKTNRVKDLEKLKKTYEPQILIYARAVADIYGKLPEKSSLHFLENNEVVDILVNNEKLEMLSEELNSFLSFISKHDTIDKYIYSNECNEYCKYKEFCDRKIENE